MKYPIVAHITLSHILFGQNLVTWSLQAAMKSLGSAKSQVLHYQKEDVKNGLA